MQGRRKIQTARPKLRGGGRRHSFLQIQRGRGSTGEEEMTDAYYDLRHGLFIC